MEKKNNLLEKIFYTFCLAVFLLPLERIGSISYAGVNIRFSQILILLIFVLYFAYSLFQKKLEIKFPKPLVLYVLFIIVCLISLIGAKEKMRGLMISIFLSFMAIVPFVSVFVLDNKEKIKKVTKVLLISALLFSAFGIFQFFGDIIGLPNSITGLSDRYVKAVLGFPRIQSTFIEPLYFANYLIIPMMLTIFLALRKGNSKKNFYTFILLSIFFLIVTILTLSKGALASLAIVVLGIVIFQVRSIFSKENITYLLVTLLVIFSLGWMTISTLQSQPDFDKFYNKAYEIVMGGSVTERQEAYSVASEAYYSNPVIGIGVGNFGPYFSGYPVSAPDFGWPIANNEYLEIVSETGMVGLIFFLAFLLSILYYSYSAFKHSNDSFLKAVLLALNFALVGILIQYMTFSTLYIMHIWFLIGFILAIQQIIFEDVKNKKIN